jgi:hypothetical protein
VAFTSILFLLIYALGLILALARHPIFGLVTYLGVFYLAPQFQWWGASLPSFRWSLVAAVLTMIALYVHKDKLQAKRMFSHPVMLVQVLFVVWLVVQSPWALVPDDHFDLIVLYVKYLILMFLIYRIIDSEKRLRFFMWIHVIGCFLVSWTAYTQYTGGRFEGFIGADFGESNIGALLLVTGLFPAGMLFLTGSIKEKLVLVALLPFVVNGVVTTESRSAFLAAAFGGVVFNWCMPKTYRARVIFLSLLALVLFVALTNPYYWERIGSLKYAGADVEGVDTGAGRIVIVEAQWRMFLANPLGWGHRGTVVLSTQYLSSEYLTAFKGPNGTVVRGRASHNTFMTMLVEHGIVGAFVYIFVAIWSIKNTVFWSFKRYGDGFPAAFVPALGGILCGFLIGDLFIDYQIFEIRLWFIAILMVMIDLRRTATEADEDEGRQLSTGGVSPSAAFGALS